MKFNFAGFGRSPAPSPPARFTFSGFAKAPAGGSTTGGALEHRCMWSPERHARYGEESRAVVVAVLTAARRPTCSLSRLPLELLFEVFGWTWQGALPGPFRPHARLVRLPCYDQFSQGMGPLCTSKQIFVPCDNLGGIAVFTHVGELVRHIGAGILKGCRGVAMVGDNLFATDVEGQRVAVFRATDGALVRHFPARMTPHGIAAADGLLYVGGPDSSCVRVFREDGTVVRTITAKDRKDGEFLRPMGLAVCAGEVFVVDYWHNCVFVLNADSGVLVRTIGRGVLTHPWGICERGGLLFVVGISGNYCSVFSIADGTHVANLANDPAQYPGVFRGSCVSDEGVLYITCQHGNILAFRVFGDDHAEGPVPSLP